VADLLSMFSEKEELALLGTAFPQLALRMVQVVRAPYCKHMPHSTGPHTANRAMRGRANGTLIGGDLERRRHQVTDEPARGLKRRLKNHRF
jgi:hypothetical protein